MNKHLTFSALALVALLASCTSDRIPYAGTPTVGVSTPPIGLPSLFPSGAPTPGASLSPLPSSDPNVLMILDVQPRTLSAGDSLLVRGTALDRIGTGDISLVWDLPDRRLPVTINQQSANSLSLTFPNFPATLTQVSLHLRSGNRILQGYVLRITPGGATGTPLPALAPTPDPSASPSASPVPSASPDSSPSASPDPSASPSVTPSASPSASASASASPSASPSASASASPDTSASPASSASPEL